MSAERLPERASSSPSDSVGSLETDETLAALDEELARLPDHYRAAVLACDVEGLTRKAAAARLGIPDGTLSNRLASARKVLARRLGGRGVTLGAGGIATILSPALAAARVPPALVGTTARLAVCDAGSPVAPAVSALADGEMKMFLFTKLNGLVVVGLALVAGAVLGAPPGAGNDRPAAPAVFVAARATREKPADPPAPTVIDTDGPLDDLAFNSDGKYIVSQSRVIDPDNPFNTRYVVKLWEVKTGKVVRTIAEGKTIHGVAFSPDGTHVAAALTKFDPTKNKPGDVREAFSVEVRVWEAATGKEMATLTDSTAHSLYHVAYSPDGKYIAAGGVVLSANSVPSGGEVTVWEVPSVKPEGFAKTGKVLWANQTQKNALRRPAFSADSKMLATPSDDGTVHVWDCFTGKQLHALDDKLEMGVASAAFSPDGKQLAAAGSDGETRIWDLTTGTVNHVLKSGIRGIQVARFLPDGSLLTAGTAEMGDGNLKLWDAKTGKLLRAIGDPNLTVRSLAVTADGKTAAVGTGEKSLVIVPLAK